MSGFNPINEVAKKQYEEILLHAKHRDPKTARAVWNSINLFENFTGKADFKTFNAEQAKSVVKDNGSLDYDALGKITAEKETAAAQAKEQEIANNSENPGGGTAGGENKKTADVENAEKISFGKPAESAEAKDHYVL